MSESQHFTLRGLAIKLPRDIGPIEFGGIGGIGGIGMSGIAEMLSNLGRTVNGADVTNKANVERPRENGIAVAIRAANVKAE
jgi:UDP-N-acetylmuramate--alanine ligase